MSTDAEMKKIRAYGELLVRAVVPTIFAEFIIKQHAYVQADYIRVVQAPNMLTATVDELSTWLDIVYNFAKTRTDEYYSPGFRDAARVLRALLSEHIDMVGWAVGSIGKFITFERSEILIERFTRRCEAIAEEQIKEFIVAHGE